MLKTNHILKRRVIVIEEYEELATDTIQEETELPGGPYELLTNREIDVLTLIAQGYTNGETADHLSISTRTVESHRANLAGKLDAHNRADLVKFALEFGLLSNERH